MQALPRVALAARCRERRCEVKAFRIVLCTVDLDECGVEEMVQLIENARLPNRVDPGTVMSIDVADCGEWSDEHPLNSPNDATRAAEFARLFPAATGGAK